MFPRSLTAVVRSVSSAKIGSHAARCFVSASTPTLEKHSIKVPTMGDSITEGTIVEWTAQVGQMVKEGDVVALVETDKVTVDIKAEIDGVLIQQFGEVDDTVEVGSELYMLDTEAEATVDAAAPATPSADAVPKVEAETVVSATPAPTETKTVTAKLARVPSIKFLGKEGWARVLSGYDVAVIYDVPPNFGRPVFSNDEMDALITGGANLAPDVKHHSSGALFG